MDSDGHILGSRNFVALLFCAAAAFFAFWLGPRAALLPDDYFSEVSYNAQNHFRSTPDGEWVQFPLIGRRVDQALVSSATCTVIQGDLHWSADDGSVTYEITGLFGVDRRTRANKPDHGNLSRFGQFLFPCWLEPVTYNSWDSYYGTPAVARFEGTERIDGLEVYVFRYRVGDYDDTNSYEWLPTVPEQYRVTARGGGRLWIEPVSGTLVEIDDLGAGRFVDPATGKDVAEFHRWTGRHTPESRAKQLRLARGLRMKILGFQVWLPAACLVAASFCLASGFFRGYALRRRPRNGAGEENGR